MYFFYKRSIKDKNQYIDISLVLWLLSHYFIVKPDQAFSPWQWDYSNRDTWNDFVHSNRLVKRIKESQGFCFFFCKRTNKIQNLAMRFKWPDLSGNNPQNSEFYWRSFCWEKKIRIRWSSSHTVMNLLFKSWICWWFYISDSSVHSFMHNEQWIHAGGSYWNF